MVALRALSYSLPLSLCGLPLPLPQFPTILPSTFSITFQSQRVILGDALFSLSPSDLSSISFQDGTTLPKDATVDLRWLSFSQSQRPVSLEGF